MSFDLAFQRTVGVEGDYSDNPNDRGGKTRFGITEVKARAHGYQGDMKDLPIEVAKAIYQSDIWDRLSLLNIDARSADLSAKLFDIGVNCGIEEAGLFLQRALNAFNRQGRDYADVPVDGSVGPVTLTAFRALLDGRGRDGITVLLRALNAQQGQFYLNLPKSHPEDEDFEFGWFLQRIF